MEWNVSPVVFEWGTLTIRWYGVCFGGGFLLGYWMLARIFQRDGLPSALLEPLFWYIFWGTLIGARLGHIIFYEPSYYLSHPFEILAVWHGGLASHGGAVGIAVALAVFFQRRPKLGVLLILDRLAVIIPLAAGFIRLGNLMNSEIIGRPTNVAWAFVFTRVDMLPRHPAQLYEALAYFGIFGLLWCLKRRFDDRSGFLFGAMLCSIFLLRFLIEFVKENQAAFESTLALNMGQILSFPFMAAGMVFVVRALRTSPKASKP